MRIDYASFMALYEQAPPGTVFRQFIFVKLPDPPGDASPIDGDPGRVWATVDDDAVIQRMRVYVPAEDRIYVAGVGSRIDYDPVERPTLIVHDVV